MSTTTGLAGWTREDTIRWVERHGGNVSRLALRLGISRARLNAALTDPSRAWYRPLSDEVVAHMRTIDLHET